MKLGMATMAPAALRNVKMTDSFWAPRIETNRKATLPVEYRQCKDTGRIDAFRLDWKPGQPNPPHIFWDSDVAKWVEAAAYSIETTPNPDVAKMLDEVVDLICGAQQPDGYLNCHFTVVEPQKRWSNLALNHELYCAGHLMEAAVAHYRATGNRKMLDCLCRYADYIDSVFGAERGKKRGYPGHEEIELALVKLFRTTGNRKYLKLSMYFVDERGRDNPHYYDEEAKAAGKDAAAWRKDRQNYEYCQAHKPVREQDKAVGHAVRAMYLYCGMADVAAETKDASLLLALENLWKNVTERRMYLTGGVGSAREHERFTNDYDLPPETAYAETCANIGLVFWAHRMLQMTGDGQYADVMERALYNSVLSGISLDGKKFFYANPLNVFPETYDGRPTLRHATRQDWFDCACCPPNIARLLASFGQYVYSGSPDGAWVHLFVQGEARFDVADRTLKLSQTTEYPWDGKVRIRVEGEGRFTLRVRIPEWCCEPRLKVAGKPVALQRITKSGYAIIARAWKPGDTVDLMLPMPVELIAANPKAWANRAHAAIQRGPVVYCLEEIDNGPGLERIVLSPKIKLKAQFEPKLLGGAVVINGQAMQHAARDWAGRLYAPVSAPKKKINITAVPYCLWNNRGKGAMMTWVRMG